MNKKSLYLFLFFILFISVRLFAQCESPYPEDCADPGGYVPIPGVLYFLAALLGIGIKKIYKNARKSN